MKKIKIPIRKKKHELIHGRSGSAINYNTFSYINEHRLMSSSGIDSISISIVGGIDINPFYGHDTCFINGRYASKLEK